MVLSKQCPDGQPRSPGTHNKQTNLTETSMTFSRIETLFDRIAPTFLLGLGLIASFATAGLGF